MYQSLTSGIFLAITLPVNSHRQHRGQKEAVQMKAVQAHMESNGPRTVLGLDEMTLVEVEVVRFFGVCEAAGIAVLHCSP